MSRTTEIRDLQLLNADVNVEGGDGVGPLAGYLDESGIVQRCRATGAVTGSWAVGGLVGFAQGRAEVVGCCVAATVAGRWDIGGLVGYHEGYIENCHARGSVTGESGVGGLAGSCGSYSDIRQCYSTGRVVGDGNVGGLVGEGLCGWGSFWDIETSGQTASTGGKGRTTAELQTAATFQDAGWDFVGEDRNGREDIWWIDEGKGYPRLWWERDVK